MKLNVFSYYNKKGGFYNKPFIEALPAEAVAQSTARTCIVEKEAAKKAHLDESALYQIGYFDDQTGTVESMEDGKPKFIEDFDKYVQQSK